MLSVLFTESVFLYWFYTFPGKGSDILLLLIVVMVYKAVGVGCMGVMYAVHSMGRNHCYHWRLAVLSPPNRFLC